MGSDDVICTFGGLRDAVENGDVPVICDCHDGSFRLNACGGEASAEVGDEGLLFLDGFGE